ncbi:MAG: hypothetical protein NVV59_03250 [Chitinophagaceae bacterium]|nr:hypothetical protein [Chitinophagaceae bacterium]
MTEKKNNKKFDFVRSTETTHVLFQCCVIIFSIFIFTACNNIKKLPAGEALYTGAKLKLDSIDVKRKERKSVKRRTQQFDSPKTQ